MFRFRIKDWMILNVVLAIVLAGAITLKKSGLVLNVLAVAFLVSMLLPLLLAEIYLYGQGKGTWYRLRHPIKRRPTPAIGRYQELFATLDSARGLVKPEAETEPARPRTQLFGAGDSARPVSRARILLDVAQRLAESGRVQAAEKVYRQVLEDYGDSTAAREGLEQLARRGGRSERGAGSPLDA